MTKKLFRSIMLVACAVLLACLVLVMGVLYEYFTAMQGTQLTAQMELAVGGVESGGAGYLESLNVKNCRITWIAADGTVLYDSKAEAGAMENHSDREEVRQALASGTGESSRYSSTLAEKTIYRASRLTDGTVLRVSVTQYTVLTLLMGMIQPVLIVLAAAIILSAVLAGRAARRIVKPLNRIDLDEPLASEAYEELSPLLGRIEKQHRQINEQLYELRRSRDEFEAVTASMNEGLVLLSDKGAVLSINPAACRVFGTDGDCVGKDFLTVDRDRGIARAVEAAVSGGHGEVAMARAGREYQLDASRIGRAGEVAGVALLVFDVTEKTFAERNRREFTANVSHELKTPLQSIMGSAELIESGLVKPGDIPRFAGNIRAETARLVALIDDIIRLSQLDEGGELPGEQVDLYSLAEETADSLSDAAKAGKVSLSVQGGSAQVSGVRRLMHEIIFNLCDNAIKYNREGGSVVVTVKDGESAALLTVEDTGIGIPPEDRDRVFERFYRVDKSHSKKIGGTGLGLSIVKHAAAYLGAEISLESEPGRGTRAEVSFPK